MRRMLLTTLVMTLLASTKILAAPLKLQKETDHFQIFATDADLGCLEQVVAALEGSYARIASNLGVALTRRTKVEIYPNLKAYHAASGLANPADWMVGNSTRSGSLKMVSPSNPGPTHDFEGMIQVAVHEFAHTVVNGAANGKKVPKWLNEGIAAYESGQMNSQRRRVLEKAVAGDAIPAISDIPSDSKAFGNMGGYQYSYTITEFLVKEYGWEKVRELVRKPHEVRDIFGVSEAELSVKWAGFLRANYGS